MSSEDHQSDRNPYSFLNFSALQVKPPIATNSVKNFPPSVIATDAASTRIVIHPRFPDLVSAFLQHKRLKGSEYEKAIYGTADTFTWRDQVARLIEKRPLVFMGKSDETVLRNGERIFYAQKEWDNNGTSLQHMNKHLTLADYLSYDEIMLSSLLGVSGPSYFVNNGARFNCGKPGVAGTFQPRGIIIGLVGARFERKDRMDCVFVLPPTTQPKQHPELTQLFFDFFGVQKNLANPPTFDSAVYKARIRIAADILLLEANACIQGERTAYVYVVGLGLGVWVEDDCQAEQYILAFADAIVDHSLEKITTIEFAHITVSPECEAFITGVGAEKNIRVLFSKRDSAEKLPEERREELVLSYAWDGNAFPGNEYWKGGLSASGDPAAACMSTISELHNPLINPGFTKRVVVAGEQGIPLRQEETARRRQFHL